MLVNKKSIIICYPDMQTYYTGKIIGDTYFRNFKLNSTVVWKDREFGINVEIIDYLKENGVKYIVYINTSKRDDSYRISLDKFMENAVIKEYSFGRQYFIPMDSTTKLKKTPNIPYVKAEVIVEVRKNEE